MPMTVSVTVLVFVLVPVFVIPLESMRVCVLVLRRAANYSLFPIIPP